MKKIVGVSVITNDEIVFREIISVFNTINIISKFKVYDFESDRPSLIIISGK